MRKINSLSGKKKAFFPFPEDVRRYGRLYGFGFLTLILVDIVNVIQPLIIKEAIDALLPKNLRVVWISACLALVTLWLQAIGRYWWRIFLLGSSHRIAADIRTRFFNHLVKLPSVTHSKTRTGDLMSRATNDLESVRLALGPGVLVALDALVLFILIVPMMFSLSVKMALLSLAFYPLVPWLTAKIGAVIDRRFEVVQAKLSALSANAQESFAGIRLIKSLCLEPVVGRRFSELSGQYTQSARALAKVEAPFSPLLSLITNLGTFLILFVGGMDVMAGAITVGTFVAFQRFVVQLSWPMEAIGWSVTINREGRAAERRLRDILEEAELQDSLPGKTDGWIANALLEVKDLHVSYPNGEAKGFDLHLQNLAVPAGYKVGLVGGVGSGKSMLFEFLTRLRESPPGSIGWRGQDLRAVGLTRLRAEIGIVEQQITLFGETVRANLTMGMSEMPDESLIHQVLNVTQLTEEIMALPNGLDTILGERGVNLSGGQKQRLALARALIRRPKLLLMDDCFSAVDVTNEQGIVDGLVDAFPDMAVICASHRLSVMRRMDEIWLLENGRLRARGNHAQLLKLDTLYQELNEKSSRLALLASWEMASEKPAPEKPAEERT